ncbi:hypothetical protein K438DRAFT_1878078, partial [Mycena galopus ATCC 62051]
DQDLQRNPRKRSRLIGSLRLPRLPLLHLLWMPPDRADSRHPEPTATGGLRGAGAFPTTHQLLSALLGPRRWKVPLQQLHLRLHGQRRGPSTDAQRREPDRRWHRELARCVLDRRMRALQRPRLCSLPRRMGRDGCRRPRCARRDVGQSIIFC